MVEIVLSQHQHEIPRLANELSRERDVILLLRHAHREPITEATLSAAFGAQITETGRQEAREFGGHLDPGRPVRLFHSPVQRCEETARAVAEGAGASGRRAWVEGERRFLGASFIQDGERIVEIFAEMGLRGFVRAWYERTLAREIIEEAELAGRSLLLRLIGEHIPGEGSPLDIHVSHDITVLALLGLFCDVTPREFPWPGFLDGVILGLDGRRVTWWYHHREGEIPLATIKEWRLR